MQHRASVTHEAEWEPAELAARTRAGTRAIFATRALSVLATAASVTVLPRLIGPADFGVWAVAALAFAVVTFGRELGLALSIVQAHELTGEQRNAYFWISVSASLAGAAVLALAAPLLALFYDTPLLRPVTWSLCASLIVAGLGAIHAALLRRELQFGKLAFAEGGGILCGLIAALAGAYVWRDVWAFVVANIVTAVWTSAVVIASCRWTPGLPRRTGAKINLRFSLQIMWHNLLTYVGNNVGLLAGYRFAIADLGYFSRAQQLCVLLVSAFLTPITDATFAVLCRLKSEAQYREVYVAMVRRVWLIFMPCVAILPIISADAVLTLLGPNWTPASAILAWLAPAVFGQVNAVLFAQLMLSQGRGAELRTFAAVGVLACGIGAIIGSRFGLVGLAAGFSAGSLLLTIPLAWISQRSGPVRLRDQLTAMQPGIAIALVSTAAALLAVPAADGLGLTGGPGRLALVAGSAALAWAILCLAVPRARDALFGKATGLV